MASMSPAKASGSPWKLPVDITSPSGTITGLSTIEPSSMSMTRRAWASTSRTAPCTCGAQRRQYESCTAWSLSRWLATSGLPASRRRRLPALASWPGCGRMTCTRSSYGLSVPSSASTLIAAAMSATLTSRPMSSTASASITCIGSVPLISDRPSFGGQHQRLDALLGEQLGARTAAQVRSPRRRSRPSPTSGWARCASWARSPDAPTDPLPGITGSRSWASSSSSLAGSSSRTPE